MFLFCIKDRLQAVTNKIAQRCDASLTERETAVLAKNTMILEDMGHCPWETHFAIQVEACMVPVIMFMTWGKVLLQS